MFSFFAHSFHRNLWIQINGLRKTTPNYNMYNNYNYNKILEQQLLSISQKILTFPVCIYHVNIRT